MFVRLGVKKSRKERNARERGKERVSVLPSEWSEFENEKRRGHARKREEEEIRGRRVRGVRRVPGKPMILKEGREDAH